eukprot:GHVU01111574.1.p1 GENE.GHVU01111574.1~~GHVU01111574.1.p1  ORF type:complete len:541 (+),score=100.00 GHVU01111574.1:138-1760(+)
MPPGVCADVRTGATAVITDRRRSRHRWTYDFVAASVIVYVVLIVIVMRTSLSKAASLLAYLPRPTTGVVEVRGEAGIKKVAPLWWSVTNKAQATGFKVRYLPKPVTEPERLYENSWMEIDYPFRREPSLRQFHQRGHDSSLMRIGRLVEAMDSISADAIYRFIEHYIPRPQDSVDIVTVIMDGIRFERCEQRLASSNDDAAAKSDTNDGGRSDRRSGSGVAAEHCELTNISVLDDLTISSCVTAVGRSSIEARVEFSQDGKVLGSGYTLFVPLDKRTRRPKQLFSSGFEGILPGDAAKSLAARRRDRRLKMREVSAGSVPPSEQEAELLHNMWMNKPDHHHQGGPIGEGGGGGGGDPQRGHNLGISSPSPSCKLCPSLGGVSVPMSSTTVHSTTLMQPSHQNCYGMIFGGYTARLAFELSWMCVGTTTRATPELLGIDDIYFKEPVVLGSILQISATITYSDDNIFNVRTETFTLNPGESKRRLVGVVNFTYKQQADRKYLAIPENYTEYMRFLEGRRRYLLGAGAAAGRGGGGGGVVTH